MSHLERREESPVNVLRKPFRTVMNVGPMECRWVTDYVTLTGFRIFCGHTAVRADRPYCEEHYGIVYIKKGKKDDEPI
jgi:hypothetical protein